VSRVGRKVKSDWAAWSKRSLAGEDVVRLILDGTVVRARLDRRATVALRPAVPTQRRTLHRHGNLLAHAPDHLHEEVAADCTDMIHAGTAEAVAARRTAFLREWRPECRAVADSLEEAGDELFTIPPAAEPVEVGADDECRRAPARGVQAAEQDPDRPAEPGDGGAAVLGAALPGADHDAQGRRLADARPTARRRRH
jgi:transposase-like protein